MKCYRHYDREAVRSCSRCGNPLCQECSFEIDGRTICNDCVSHMLKDDERKRHLHREPHFSRKSGFTSHRHVSWLPLFIFSFILPGINYMYMGLIKRGLCIMSSVALLTYCLTLGFSPVLSSLAIGIIWVASIFDGFQLRHKINAGMEVEDGISDITEFFTKYKYGLIMVVLIFFVLSFFSALFNGFSYGSHGRLTPLFLIIVLAGFFLISRRKNRGMKEEDDDIIDKRNHM